MNTDLTPRLVAEPQRRAWVLAIVLPLAILVTFLLLAALGAAEAERGARVLGVLEPVFGKIRTLGPPSLVWCATQAPLIGWAVTVAAAALAASGLLTAGKRAFVLVVLMASVCLATWGQILLFTSSPLAVWLYACGVACAVVVGIAAPLHRLEGFPRLPLPSTDGETPLATAWLSRRAEGALLFGLVLVALCTRLYALVELPEGFDVETIIHTMQSRTQRGLWNYVQSGFLSNAPGLVHLLTNAVLFRLFGASVYTVRLTATFWGVAAVPLFYWLVRRLAGVGPAIVATVLFIAAPEQLFWSRSENNFFAPVAVVALVTAHLGLWMVERFSFWAVVGAAAWMPVCRYFYIPSMILFAYPLMLCAHAVLFVRGAWRKTWYVLPVLTVGCALWIFSLSLLFAYADGAGWRFVNPTIVYGAPAWRKQGEYRDASVPELIRLQSASVMRNLGLLLQGMVQADSFPTHWYQRYAIARTSSTLNAGLAVVAALGLGYLAAQFYERRAAVLLLWLLLGVLPACLSTEPGARRMAVAFPAIEAIAGVMLAAVVRIVRVRGGRKLGRDVAALLGVAVLGILWTSLISHFLVGMGPPAWVEHARFTKPVFATSDVVLTDVPDARVRSALLFGDLDRFVRTPFCWQYVETRQWIGAALHPKCDFSDEIYQLLMPSERIAALRAAYQPQRITYVVDLRRGDRDHLDLLRILYPTAEVREDRNPSQEPDFATVSVTLADVGALHVAELANAPDDRQVPQGELLENVALVPGGTTDSERLVVRGGLFLERDGWYRFDLEPSCSLAMLTIDGQERAASETRPMLAGLHAFELVLPRSGGCQLPLHLVESQAAGEMASVPAYRFVSPVVAAQDGVQAPSVTTYPGYGAASVFADLRGPVGLGADARGHLSVLSVELGSWHIRRLDPDGHEEAIWQLPITEDPRNVNLAVDGDGACVVTAGRRVFVYTATGELSASWENEFPEWISGVALWGSDGLLMAMPARHAVILAGRDGTVRDVLKSFAGGPGKLDVPVAVSTDAGGHILVIENSGKAILFRSPGDAWQPEFMREFRIDFSSLPAQTVTSVIDNSRVLVAERSTGIPLVYTLEGERLLAETAARDLSTKGFAQVGALQAAGDRLYVLDPAANRIWLVSR